MRNTREFSVSSLRPRTSLCTRSHASAEMPPNLAPRSAGITALGGIIAVATTVTPDVPGSGSRSVVGCRHADAHATTAAIDTARSGARVGTPGLYPRGRKHLERPRDRTTAVHSENDLHAHCRGFGAQRLGSAWPLTPAILRERVPQIRGE